MSAIAAQALVLATAGFLFVLAILRLARRHHLSARYAIGWIGLGLMLILAAALLPFVGRIGRLASVSPTAALLILSSLALLAIAVQLSISVSHSQESIRTLAENQALLRRQMEESSEDSGTGI